MEPRLWRMWTRWLKRHLLLVTLMNASLVGPKLRELHFRRQQYRQLLGGGGGGGQHSAAAVVVVLLDRLAVHRLCRNYCCDLGVGSFVLGVLQDPGWQPVVRAYRLGLGRLRDLDCFQFGANPNGGCPRKTSRRRSESTRPRIQLPSAVASRTLPSAARQGRWCPSD